MREHAHVVGRRELVHSEIEAPKMQVHKELERVENFA